MHNSTSQESLLGHVLWPVTHFALIISRITCLFVATTKLLSCAFDILVQFYENGQFIAVPILHKSTGASLGLLTADTMQDSPAIHEIEPWEIQFFEVSVVKLFSCITKETLQSEIMVVLQSTIVFGCVIFSLFWLL